MDMDIERAPLNIDSLKDAVTAFEKSINAYNANALSMDEDVRDTMRSGVIKNFETAYDMCWKYMKKWLEINTGPDIVEYVSRKEFYRIAWENGLIPNVRDWWGFHDLRNRATRIYNETVAEEVFNAVVKFINVAKNFTGDLEGRL